MARGSEGLIAVSPEDLCEALGIDPDEFIKLEDEIVFQQLVDGLESELEIPEDTVVLANNLESDRRTRLRIARILGGLAVEGAIPAQTSELNKAEKASLVQVVEDLQSEDPELREAAEARLTTDFLTNVFEILRASGHISRSYSDYAEDGFYQHGYSQLWMYAHGVLHTQHPTEQGRRVYETLNEGRIADGFIDGMFERFYFVEESRAPLKNEMAPEDADEHGYNTTTWKVMLRLTDVDRSGHRITESASVCGVDGDGNRRDVVGLRNIRNMLGLSPDADLTGVVIPVEGLEGAYWVMKDMLPLRSASLAKHFDNAFDGDNFFGVEGEIGDYETVASISQDREDRVIEQVQERVNELAAAIHGLSCEEALLVMAQCAKDFATDVCIEDVSYDAEQFGETAAKYIEIARIEASLGDVDAARRAAELAKDTAIVYMCGIRLDMDRIIAGRGDSPESDAEYSLDQISGNADNELKFKCPHGHDNERPAGKFITHCRKCGVDVSCGMTGSNMIDTAPKERSVLAKLWAEADASRAARQRARKVEASARRPDRQADARKAVNAAFQGVLVGSSN